jgi:hypothetical protein
MQCCRVCSIVNIAFVHNPLFIGIEELTSCIPPLMFIALFIVFDADEGLRVRTGWVHQGVCAQKGPHCAHRDGIQPRAIEAVPRMPGRRCSLPTSSHVARNVAALQCRVCGLYMKDKYSNVKSLA